MSQDVGQRLKIKIQRLKIKIQCLKIKTKKGLLMVWWRPLPSPASQQPASLEASRPEVAPPAQPWPAWRPAPTASRPEVAPPLQPTSSHSPPTPEVAPPPKPSHPAHCYQDIINLLNIFLLYSNNGLTIVLTFQHIKIQNKIAV